MVFCLLSAKFYAQEASTIDSLKIDGQRLINYDELLTTRLSFSDNFNSFLLKDKKGKSEFLISPNQQINATLSLAYRFIEIDLGYTPKFIRFNKDDAISGKTEFLNLGTRFYVGQFMQKIQYGRTKGFYVEDFEFPEFDKFVISNLKVVKYGGNTSYIFNPNFSFKALFKQNEWQTQSAGSFVPSLSYYWTKISDDSSEKDMLFDVTIGPSYFYNWIIKNSFLISVGGHAGIGYNQTKHTFTDSTPTTKVESLIYTTELKLGLGYNSNRFFTGMNVTFDAFYHNDEPDFRMNDQQRYFEFYLGYRFNTPKTLKTSTDYIQEKIIRKKKTP